jgi:hypothetical protein
VRPAARLPPLHRPLTGPSGYATETEDESRFFDRPCYAFNRTLPTAYDDRHCSHCRHYLTSRCPHIDEFLDDVEELGPE